jgi:hypothetical protein
MKERKREKETKGERLTKERVFGEFNAHCGKCDRNILRNSHAAQHQSEQWH